MDNSTLNKIRFHFLMDSFLFNNRTKLKMFLLRQLKKEKREVEAINYIFCTDEYLLQINKQYLNHNTYTDIITFELSPKGQAVVADIYISVERVKDNAKEYGSTFKQEMHRVIFHGALHLAGYKDKSKEDAAIMRQMEDKWWKLYSFHVKPKQN